MNAKRFEELLNSFEWSLLSRLHGSAHSSLIGFITFQWLIQSSKNEVLDGAPVAERRNGRTGQTQADIILCKDDKPTVVVEVENTVKNYQLKVQSLSQYLKPNSGDVREIELGLLLMNSPTSKMNDKYVFALKEEVRKENQTIALVWINRRKIGESNLKLRMQRSDYYRWDIDKIDYWIYEKDHIESIEGTLWKNNYP